MTVARFKLVRCTSERAREIVKAVRKIANESIRARGLRGNVSVRQNVTALDVALVVYGATDQQLAEIGRPVEDYLGSLCAPGADGALAPLTGYDFLGVGG